MSGKVEYVKHGDGMHISPPRDFGYSAGFTVRSLQDDSEKKHRDMEISPALER